MLLERNKNIVNVADKDGNTPLHLAAEGGDVNIVDRICTLVEETGEQAECTNNKGQTPLHFAARGGRGSPRARVRVGFRCCPRRPRKPVIRTLIHSDGRARRCCVLPPQQGVQGFQRRC